MAVDGGAGGSALWDVEEIQVSANITLTVADLNADDSPDVIAADEDGSRVSIILNNAESVLISTEVPFPRRAISPVRVTPLLVVGRQVMLKKT